MTTFRARLTFLALATIALGITLGGIADGRIFERRDTAESLVRPMELSGPDLTRVRNRAEGVARSVGIVGEAGTPRRRFEALDHAVFDEVAVNRPDGRVLAVVRLDADRGEIRSLVPIGWTPDDDRAQTSAATVPSAAARYAKAIDISPPRATPEAAWDDAMHAWRVSWPRVIDGIEAPGEGLTVWVYRGGRLAALRRIETPAASAPLLRIPSGQAEQAARDWAATTGVPAPLLTVAAPKLAWVVPNDFASHGGADATEARLHLAWTVPLTIRPPAGDTSRILLFVDAGSGAVIGGVGSA
jgi:hypothetical protein